MRVAPVCAVAAGTLAVIMLWWGVLRTPGEAASREVSPAQQDAETAATLEAAVRSESVDPEWSNVMKVRISEFFKTDKATGSSARRIDCRSTLCRVEVAHESIDARKHFVERMPYMIPPRSTVFGHVDSEEDREIVLYISREGHPLPLD
ncbi:hypothetical protein [Sorangium sp. So ce854]|uniref:hypothetical protein n=1 Tax=Sorangium sp. So ce854 TaxID=3133322 RepID=UPI003F61CA3D